MHIRSVIKQLDKLLEELRKSVRQSLKILKCWRDHSLPCGCIVIDAGLYRVGCFGGDSLVLVQVPRTGTDMGDAIQHIYRAVHEVFAGDAVLWEGGVYLPVESTRRVPVDPAVVSSGVLPMVSVGGVTLTYDHLTYVAHRCAARELDQMRTLLVEGFRLSRVADDLRPCLDQDIQRLFKDLETSRHHVDELKESVMDAEYAKRKAGFKRRRLESLEDEGSALEQEQHKLAKATVDFEKRLAALWVAGKRNKYQRCVTCGQTECISEFISTKQPLCDYV